MSRRFAVAVCAAAAWLVLTAGAQAATFAVTTTADTVDGTCDSNCSIRDAITAPNGADGNVVPLPAGTIKLNTSDSPFGELRILRDMTITGAGARASVIDGNGRSR